MGKTHFCANFLVWKRPFAFEAIQPGEYVSKAENKQLSDHRARPFDFTCKNEDVSLQRQLTISSETFRGL